MNLDRKRTIVIKLSGRILVACGHTLKVRSYKAHLSKTHAVYHELIKNELRPKTFISDIAKNPEKILKLNGRKKENLALFLALVGEYRLTRLENLEKKQEHVYRLARYDRKEWRTLLNEDPYSFVRLEERLGVDIVKKLDMEGEMIGLLNDNGFRKRSETSFTKFYDSKGATAARKGACSLLARVHADFCEKPDHGDSVDGIRELYNKMIGNILNDDSDHEMIPEMPFYPEISLYNDFLISKSNLQFLNSDLLHHEYKTIGERAVRDYIKRKMDDEMFG